MDGTSVTVRRTAQQQSTFFQHTGKLICYRLRPRWTCACYYISTYNVYIHEWRHLLLNENLPENLNLADQQHFPRVVMLQRHSLLVWRCHHDLLDFIAWWLAGCFAGQLGGGLGVGAVVGGLVFFVGSCVGLFLVFWSFWWWFCLVWPVFWRQVLTVFFLLGPCLSIRSIVGFAWPFKFKMTVTEYYT